MDVAGEPIVGRRAWRGAELQHRSDWIVNLAPEQVGSLYQLADKLPVDSDEWPGLNLDEYCPESLTGLITAVSAELSSGRGFALIRGIDPADTERLRRVFWVFGVGVGQPVMQNAKGEVLSIVADRFAGAERGRDTRGYESNDELRFHCDGGDCIAMCCIRQAPEGGLNGLVSLFAIYNEILANYPEHMQALKTGYELYSRKEQGDAASTKNLGKVQERRIPVFAWHQGRMSAWLNIQLAEIAAEVSGKNFGSGEREALACVETIANRPDLQLTFMQQPGDVLLINNLAVMHRREKYFDSVDAAEKRSLYRMWLNLHDSQPVLAAHSALRQGIPAPSPAIAAL